MPEQESKTGENATVQWLQLVLSSQPYSGRSLCSLCQSQCMEPTLRYEHAFKGARQHLLVDHWGSWRRVGVTTWKLLPFSDSICPWFLTPCNLCGMLNAESVHVLQADDPCSSESETQKEVLIWLFFYSLQCRENFDSMSCCCKRWLFIKHMKKA